MSDVFLAACRREPVPYTPIWIMRQAGRYLPEYRELRAKVDFVTLTRTPELAAEVTLQPLRRYPLDAAILFSDIMTPLQGMGVSLVFQPGPIVSQPIRTDAQVDALPALRPADDVPFVLESIRLIRRSMPREVPLIGFAGAPFTLMCYLVGGKPSKESPRPVRCCMRNGHGDAAPRTARRRNGRVSTCAGRAGAQP